MAISAERRGPAPAKFDCGVPFDRCKGSPIGTTKGVSGASQGRYKAHSSYTEAQRCVKHYAEERSMELGTNWLPSKPQRLKAGKAKVYVTPKVRG